MKVLAISTLSRVFKVIEAIGRNLGLGNVLCGCDSASTRSFGTGKDPDVLGLEEEEEGRA